MSVFRNDVYMWIEVDLLSRHCVSIVSIYHMGNMALTLAMSDAVCGRANVPISRF